MTALPKVKPFPGLQEVAPEAIEGHETETALRAAQYALDVQLHDLRSEFSDHIVPGDAHPMHPMSS
jgi:hypothetical protein